MEFIWTPCAQLYLLAAATPQPLPSPRIFWAHIRRRYWSAKIDDISLRPRAARLADPDQDAAPICDTGPGYGSWSKIYI
jgi:hypothetical protein